MLQVVTQMLGNSCAKYQVKMLTTVMRLLKQHKIKTFRGY